ncbi:helix-turn-helix domain-containing protein [Alkalicoccobacillus gibsonii]|uniref:helix-turn-helix domain-containing protein n=1 Tax=Alkalicoccobacillus gibsonii TaxID=79881 RepID=UPI003512C80A
MDIFTTDIHKSMNHATGQMENQIYLRVYSSMFTSGLVAKMRLHNFATLMTIASYMNEDGECYPTQEQLAERMGVHKNSVSKYVNQLLAFEVNGKPIITREVVNRGQGKISSFYRIQPISQLAIFSGEVESLTNNVTEETQTLGVEEHKDCDVTKASELKPLNNIQAYTPKDVLTMFQTKYHEQYNVNFNPSWGRDMNLVKGIMKKYPSDQLEEIIDIAVTEYDSRWKSHKFPRPTLGAISSFIGDQAQAIILERREQDKQYADYEEQAKEKEEEFEDKLSKLDNIEL